MASAQNKSGDRDKFFIIGKKVCSLSFSIKEIFI
jgi:hypothetical protein